MHEYELSMKHLESEKEVHVMRLDDLESNNKQMADDITEMNRKTIETQIKFEGEEKKNERLFNLLQEAEEKVQDLEGTKLGQVQKALELEILKTAKLDQELEQSNKTREFGANMHERQMADKVKENMLYLQRLKIMEGEVKEQVDADHRARKANITLRKRTDELEGEIKVMRAKHKLVEQQIGGLKESLVARDDIERTLKDRIMDLELDVARAGVKKDTLEVTKDENIKWLKKELDYHQSYAMKALDRNAMMGEDYRSTALRHVYTIEDLKKEIK